MNNLARARVQASDSMILASCNGHFNY